MSQASWSEEDWYWAEVSRTLGRGQDVLFEDAVDDVVELGLYSDNGLKPCIFSFDYSRSAEELRRHRGAPTAENASAMLGMWKDTPPLGGNLVYVSAEAAWPTKVL